MAYDVRISRAASKTMAKLPREVARRLVVLFEALGANPRPVGHQALRGRSGDYRVRSGDYRVIYRVIDQQLVVLIVKVGHRKDVYR